MQYEIKHLSQEAIFKVILKGKVVQSKNKRFTLISKLSKENQISILLLKSKKIKRTFTKTSHFNLKYHKVLIRCLKMSD